MTDEIHDLAAFLLEAKRLTYAGLDDEATVRLPLLKGSKQLEHQAGPYAYRDIYFGMGFFVGQETVSKADKVVWSMSYSGGASPGISDRGAILSIYKFLRQALLAGQVDSPYRGPASFEASGMNYLNRAHGTLARFHGDEEISQGGKTLFEFRYSGGMLQ